MWIIWLFLIICILGSEVFWKGIGVLIVLGIILLVIAGASSGAH